jgi:hypothetical protein
LKSATFTTSAAGVKEPIKSSKYKSKQFEIKKKFMKILMFELKTNV